MKHIIEILAGIGILIGIYLFLRYGNETVEIISALADTATEGITVLQGRG